MAQLPISSITSTGREDRIDQNFTELYTARAAWTAYTPTLAVGSGALTSASATGRYVQVGKTVHVQINVTITTNGTAATNLSATLPVSAKTGQYYALAGYEDASGAHLVGGISNGDNKAYIAKTGWVYPGADGFKLVVT